MESKDSTVCSICAGIAARNRAKAGYHELMSVATDNSSKSLNREI